MANPNPKTEQIQGFQYIPIGDRPMGKVIGTRYPEDIEAALSKLPDKQAFIRSAVENALRESGQLN
jgi:hypothetical protein